jgi:hypothetical protein
MNSVHVPAELTPYGNYQVTRFNALRHGVLSRYTVLPWEDEAEYRTLLVVAYFVGPTVLFGQEGGVRQW